MYVLMLFILKNSFEKANKIIKKIPREIVGEIEEENVAFDYVKEFQIIKQENNNLNKKNKILENKIERQKKVIQELENKNKELISKSKEITTEFIKKVNNLTKNIGDNKAEIYNLKLDKNNFEQLNESSLKKSYELETRIEELLQQKTINLSQNEFDDSLTELEQPKELLNKIQAIQVLVFGDLPHTTLKQDLKYKFVLFKEDYSSYQFNDSYDEYWYVEDKLSPKEKRQIAKNENAEKINWIKKTYATELKK